MRKSRWFITKGKKLAKMTLLVSFCFALVMSNNLDVTFASSAVNIPSNARQHHTYLTIAPTPVWTEPTSTGTSRRIRILNACGEDMKLITIVEIITNRFGNDWGRTVNDTYVFMGNLTDDWGNKYQIDDFVAVVRARTPVRTTPAREARAVAHWEVGRRATIVNVYYNDRGSEWWTTSCGHQVYSGNLDS